jgi:hypothetical protein
VGYEEDVQAMELADDVKQQLIQAHRAEVDPLRNENRTLSAETKKEKVEGDIEALKAMGFEDAPGLLVWVRRVYLSADAEEPGAVLLADNELGLSGDAASGATGREEISVAGAIRKFVDLMPKEDGKLKINLGEQITGDDDHGRPDEGGEPSEEERQTQRRERATRLSGRPIDRAAVRAKRYGVATIGGGGE